MQAGEAWERHREEVAVRINAQPLRREVKVEIGKRRWPRVRRRSRGFSIVAVGTSPRTTETKQGGGFCSSGSKKCFRWQSRSRQAA